MATRNQNGKKTSLLSKAAKKRSSPAPSGPSTQSLHRRLKVAEGHIATLNENLGLPAAGADSDMEPVTFSLTAGGPKLVRLTLDGKETILLGSDAKDSLPRANGVTISVFMETWGDPGQQASIDVTNARPTPMTSSVLTTDHAIDTRTLKTSF
jgi:hypothetical protein